ncbi:MAG: tRNA lysidine(34) synthetase TilS [Erysipelotrichaceae bacterium]
MELLDKDKKYIVAVSGGPDSMALLHMCLKQKLNICVAHVNYRKRDNAFKEMESVETFCIENNIPFYCLNKEYKYKGNFQAFARKYRYDFFVKIANKYNYDCVLVGHNEDDVLETYLMYEEKNLEGEVFGIAKESSYKGLKIYRPLLSYSKQELIDYCNDNDVIYFIDESNLSNDFTRNKIRHSKVDKLNKEERIALLKEIEIKNIEKQKLVDKVEPYTNINKINVNIFNDFNLDEKLMFLRLWFSKFIKKETYSKKFLLEIIKAIDGGNNFEIPIGDSKFVRSYEVCEVMGNDEIVYSFDIISNRAFKTDYFTISDTGKTIEGISVKDDEWPITIRNYREGDSIKLRFGTKKISRWFIDRKIPINERKLWPIVLNNKNEVIMVPGIGCNISHYTIKPNIFVIK